MRIEYDDHFLASNTEELAQTKLNDYIIVSRKKNLQVCLKYTQKPIWR